MSTLATRPGSVAGPTSHGSVAGGGREVPTNRATGAPGAVGPAAPYALPDAITGALVVLALGAPWAPGLVLPVSLLVAVLWGLRVVDTRRLALPPLVVVAAGIPLAQAVAVPTAVDPVRSAVLTVASALGWACAAALATLTPRRRAVVLGSLVVSLLVVCAQASTDLGGLTSRAGGSVVDGRAQGPFAQPNELGAYVVLLLPVCVALAARPRSRAARALLGLAVVPVLAALALSLSRGAWMGAAAATAVLVLVLPRLVPAVAIALGGVSTAVLGLALLGTTGPAAVVLSRIGSLGDPSRSPDDHRPQIWELALDAAAHRPVTGVGAGGLETWATRTDSALALETPLHAHNLVLTVLSETGAVGALALVALALVLLHGLWRAATSTTSWLVAAPLAGLAGAAVHGLIDMPWRNPGLTATAWLLAGAAAHVHRPLRPRAERPTVTPRTTRAHDQAAPISETTEHTPDRAPERAVDRTPVRRRRAWPLPTVLAVLASAALVAGLYYLPTQHEATAVVGLRSEAASEGQATTGPDELKLIAQQYSVALSDEAAVDELVDELGIPATSTAEATVDPETTTVRIAARSDDPQEASDLADRIARSAEARADEDPQVVATTLSTASPDHTRVTPPKPLLLACGLSAILVLAVGLWLLRRQR
ncbi:O-antigen ligase family protein [Janibacter melonis]|uniref:O-antigen ligase family protein n=1 Tax=Janibacter melonis TaxID=262209 RepID=UPI0017481866|nr:O-antigen ligase family protein [Janibacter melonis]